MYSSRNTLLEKGRGATIHGECNNFRNVTPRQKKKIRAIINDNFLDINTAIK